MEGALANPGKLVPLWQARWRTLRERHPYRAALALGIGMGPLGLVCTFIVGQLFMALVPPELWGNSAGAELEQLSPARMIFLAVVFAPLLETLLGQCLPIELARRLGAGPALCMLPSALLFGLGHYLNGGLAHGTTTFVGGLVFAGAYVALRTRGIGPACMAAAATHALQNGVIVSLMLAEAARQA